MLTTHFKVNLDLTTVKLGIFFQEKEYGQARLAEDFRYFISFMSREDVEAPSQSLLEELNAIKYQSGLSLAALLEYTQKHPNGPSYSEFKDVVAKSLLPLLEGVIKSQHIDGENRFVPLSANFLIYTKIGTASLEPGYENIAVVYEEKSSPEFLFLGFHGRDLAWSVVFPMLMGAAPNLRFMAENILHELQHYLQLPKTQWEYPAYDEMIATIEKSADQETKERFRHRFDLRYALLWIGMFEMMKEAEACLVEFQHHPIKEIRIEWLAQYKQNLLGLVNYRGTFEEIDTYYEEHINVREMLYFNGYSMALFIILFLLRRDNRLLMRNPQDAKLLRGDEETPFRIEDIDRVLSQDKRFFVKNIPKEYLGKCLQVMRDMDSITFIRFYTEICDSWHVKPENRTVDLNFYKQLSKKALQFDEYDRSQKLSSMGIPP